MTWADIDAHNTGGVAEQVVRELNDGFSPRLVASIHGLPLPTIYHIMADERYGVLPEIIRLKVASDRIRHGRELGRIRTLLNQIRRLCGNQARM